MRSFFLLLITRVKNKRILNWTIFCNKFFSSRGETFFISSSSPPLILAISIVVFIFSSSLSDFFSGCLSLYVFSHFPPPWYGRYGWLYRGRLYHGRPHRGRYGSRLIHWSISVVKGPTHNHRGDKWKKKSANVFMVCRQSRERNAESADRATVPTRPRCPQCRQCRQCGKCQWLTVTIKKSNADLKYRPILSTLGLRQNLRTQVTVDLQCRPGL